MYHHQHLICVSFIIVQISADIYHVPEPTIKISRPKGLEVSIPDSDGVELFAFHGNVNRPMDGLEAGQMSKDILKKSGNRWVFEDKTVRLDAGDKLYYWLFVIRNGLGYRLDDGVYSVEDKVHTEDVDGHRHVTIVKDELGMCQDSLFNLTFRLIQMQDEIKLLRDNERLLRDIAEKHTPTSNTLTIDGGLLEGDPATAVKDLLREKLNVFKNVVHARMHPTKGIVFQVPTLEDKLEILRLAKSKLANSKFTITY